MSTACATRGHIDFTATIIKVTEYRTSKPHRNRYKPWSPRLGISIVMKTTGGRMVQVSRVLAVDSVSPLRSLVKGDQVQCTGWRVGHVKTFADGTPLHQMKAADPFIKPTITKVGG